MTSNTLTGNTKDSGFTFVMPRTTDLFCSSGSRGLRGTPYDFKNDNFEHVITPSDKKRDYHYDYRDPVVEEKELGETESRDVLRPNPAGFGRLFGMPHSKLKSYGSMPEQNASYMNYVTRQDINLIFYLASIGTVLPQLGYGFPHSAAFSEEHGGYPFGAVVYGADGGAYISICDDNEEAPSQTATQWIPYRSYEWFNYAKVYNNAGNTIVAEAKGSGLSYCNNDAHGQVIAVNLKGGCLLNGGYRPIIVWRMFTVEEYGEEYTYWIDKDGRRYNSPEATITSLTLAESSMIVDGKVVTAGGSSSSSTDAAGVDTSDVSDEIVAALKSKCAKAITVGSNFPSVGDTINLAETTDALTEVTDHRRATSADQYHTWIQAYKYWVKCGDTEENIPVFFKVPTDQSTDMYNSIMLRATEDNRAGFPKKDYANAVRLKYIGGENYTTASTGLNKGTSVTYVRLRNNSDVDLSIGGTVNGGRKTKGCYVIDWRGGTDTSDKDVSGVGWRDTKSDGTVNPFALEDLAAYWNRQKSTATEYAFDVSRYGYASSDGSGSATPEYDEPVSDVIGKFEVGYKDGQLRPGLVYLYNDTGASPEVGDNFDPTYVGWTPLNTPANKSLLSTPVEKLATTPANLNECYSNASLPLETGITETSTRDIDDPFTDDPTFLGASSTTNTKANEHHKLKMESGVYERGVYFVLEALLSEEATGDAATSQKWVEIAVLQRRTSLFFPQSETWERYYDLMPDFTTTKTCLMADPLDEGIAANLTDTPQCTDYAICGPGRYRIRVRCKNTVFGHFRPGWGRYAKDENEIRDTLTLCSIPYDHVTNAISRGTYDKDIPARLRGNFWAEETLTEGDVENLKKTEYPS